MPMKTSTRTRAPLALATGRSFDVCVMWTASRPGAAGSVRDAGSTRLGSWTPTG
jgi:hypothetical protein